MPSGGIESFRVRFRVETGVGEQRNGAGRHLEIVERLTDVLAKCKREGHSLPRRREAKV